MSAPSSESLVHENLDEFAESNREAQRNDKDAQALTENFRHFSMTSMSNYKDDTESIESKSIKEIIPKQAPEVYCSVTYSVFSFYVL